mgnify:CR=1 FL=1
MLASEPPVYRDTLKIQGIASGGRIVDRMTVTYNSVKLEYIFVKLATKRYSAYYMASKNRACAVYYWNKEGTKKYTQSFYSLKQVKEAVINNLNNNRSNE